MFSLEFLLFYFMPTLNGQRTLFGITLKDDDFQTYGSPILRRYRRDLFVLLTGCAGTLAVLFSTNNLSSNSLGITYIAATFIINFFLFKYLKQTWQLRDRRTVSRLATPLKPRRLRDFSNLLIEVAIVLLVIAPFVILRFYYPHLPDIVPIHWNAAGEADGWAAKSFSSIFFMPVLTACLQSFLIILKQDIIQARLRVPADNAEMILSLKEISLRANVGMIDWCRLTVGILLATAALLVLSPIVPPSVSDGLNILIWVGLILLFSGIAFYLYRIILVNREIKTLAGQVTFQTDDEMRGWVDGLIYYNPQDTAFMVEKPGGVGYTINFARRKALLYGLLVLSPLLFVFLDLFLLKVK
ncbi:MAG TPA: DUF1648 domain-containing protein [Pyrinomonadaceae bacterium]|nr:DUF1648 domain-containing protein [Pyrinomonadaceae bacterium]